MNDLPKQPETPEQRLARILRQVADEVEKSTLLPSNQWITITKEQDSEQRSFGDSVSEVNFIAPATLRIEADFMIRGNHE